MGGFGTVNERLGWPHQNSCPVGPFYNPAGDIYSLFCLLVGIRELTELRAWAPKPVLCMSTSPISLQSILSRHFCSRSCRKHIQLPLLTGLAQAQRLSPKHPGLSGGITAGIHPHFPIHEVSNLPQVLQVGLSADPATRCLQSWWSWIRATATSDCEAA